MINKLFSLPLSLVHHNTHAEVHCTKLFAKRTYDGNYMYMYMSLELTLNGFLGTVENDLAYLIQNVQQ